MSEQEAEPASGIRRAMWLLVVPIVSAIIPWLVLASTDSSLGGAKAFVVGAIPLMGGLGALSFSFVAPVRMWPLVPYVGVGGVFLFVLLTASTMTSRDGLEFGPVKVLAIVLPLLAVAGGVVSYAWLPEPEPDYEYGAEQEPDDEGNPVG
jgi:hypothetical protein